MEISNNILTQRYLDELTYDILGCAIEVHKHLGPGLLESVYEKCFLAELSLTDLDYESQIWVPIFYKGMKVQSDLKIDVLVNKLIIVELKAVEAILPVHKAQLLTYMKLLQKPKGILINFNCTNIMKEGQKTLVNNYYADLCTE
ncbi:MAG: GxxExxY protein [Candidatus Dadabacteria bacterium]